MLVRFLLPVATLLPTEADAGEIIGGHEAKPHSRPYMAYLEIKRGDRYKRCGGSLVSENFVLMAAHCQGDSITVFLGTHDMGEWEPSWQVIPVQGQIPHPQYDRETLENDIMLLQLQEKAHRSGDVGLLSLPEGQERLPLGTVCSIAGWGRTSAANVPSSDVLQEADVTVMPDGNCQRRPEGLYENYRPATMMCVGDPAAGRTSFGGDSGGPLVCGKRAQGIVSWGSNEGTPPSVYTKVSAFLPWIRETMRKLQL